MTPEFFINRTPSLNVDNEDGYVKYKSDVYKWHQEEGVNSIINNYRKLIYQQAYNDNYEQRIVNNMGIDISLIDSSDIHGELLYKLIDEYLETRGTKTSFDILFQLMFNKTVEIKYPRDMIMNLSGYRYLRTKQIVISGNNTITLNSGLRGLRSGTMSGIESIQPYYIDGERYYIVDCNNIEDSFIINEPIEVTSLDQDTTFNEINLPLIDVAIVNGGRYYKKGDMIIPKTNVFKNSHFKVSSVSKGGIGWVDIIDGGSGYVVGDRVKATNSSHFNALVSSVDDVGCITSINVINGGYNFESIPTHTIITSDGVGAVLELHSNEIGVVTAIQIADGSLVHATGNIIYDIVSDSGIGLVVKSIATVEYKRGEYKNHRGDTYPKNLLHDSYSMHSHCYHIYSTVPASKYKNVVMKYNNPSGYNFISYYTNINIINDYNIEVTGELIRE